MFRNSWDFSLSSYYDFDMHHWHDEDWNVFQLKPEANHNLQTTHPCHNVETKEGVFDAGDVPREPRCAFATWINFSHHNSLEFSVFLGLSFNLLSFKNLVFQPKWSTIVHSLILDLKFNGVISLAQVCYLIFADFTRVSFSTTRLFTCFSATHLHVVSSR